MRLVISMFVVLCAGWVSGAEINLIPQPQKLEVNDGAFIVGPETKIAVEGATSPVGDFLADVLRKSTGLPLPITKDAGRNTIHLTLTGAKAALGPEGYELDVKPDGVVVRAVDGAGAFYGMHTLLQLLPTKVYSTNRVDGVEWKAPCVHI